MAKRVSKTVKENVAVSRDLGQKMSKSGDKVVRGLKQAAAPKEPRTKAT